MGSSKRGLKKHFPPLFSQFENGKHELKVTFPREVVFSLHPSCACLAYLVLLLKLILKPTVVVSKGAT